MSSSSVQVHVHTANFSNKAKWHFLATSEALESEIQKKRKSCCMGRSYSLKIDLIQEKQYKNIFEHRFRFIQAFLAYFELCFEPVPVQPFFRFVFLRDFFRA
jgi:hypothetical protein